MLIIFGISVFFSFFLVMVEKNSEFADLKGPLSVDVSREKMKGKNSATNSMINFSLTTFFVESAKKILL